MKTLLIDPEAHSLHHIQGMLHQHPTVSACTTCPSPQAALLAIEQDRPQLVILDAANPHKNQIVDQALQSGFELIFTYHGQEEALESINYRIGGFLIKPCRQADLELLVHFAYQRLQQREKQRRTERLIHQIYESVHVNELIGIPTIKGFEFLSVQEIVRCVGLQKCTRIITTQRSDIISSYNIGEFRKLLQGFHFFSPHKSHLINLHHILSYHKEGTIIMKDQSAVPVSRRKKTEFLDLLSAAIIGKVKT